MFDIASPFAHPPAPPWEMHPPVPNSCCSAPPLWRAKAATVLPRNEPV